MLAGVPVSFMSIIPSTTRPAHPDDQDRRRIDRLSHVVSDLGAGTTAIQDLKARLADGTDVPAAANLVKASADPIGHANVSAARTLGIIVPGP